MKFLFRITRNNVETLLRGVHFNTDGKEITLLEDDSKITTRDLYQLLFNPKYGFVIFTTTQENIYELQREIADMEAGYD